MQPRLDILIHDWADNLGAILAVADWLCRSSATDAITHIGPPLTIKTVLIALIKAYEIQGCMLLQNAFNAHGLDHIILVKLASTAVVSWLLGLTEDQTMAAISQVWMDGAALRVYRQKGNVTSRKGWAAGDACMKATQLALLTRAGQPGSPTPLTMPRWGFYANCFGNKHVELPKAYGSWVVENIIFKVMPVEGHGISSVEAAIKHVDTMKARGLHAESDIKRLVIHTNAATDLIINKTGPLTNAADRDHCLQYLVALTFLKGAAPEATDFLDSSSWSSSTSLSELRQKIDIIVDKRMTDDYMDLDVKSVEARMGVALSDGTRLHDVTVKFPIGHGKNEKTTKVVREKFHGNMGLMFSEAEIQGVLDMVEMEENEERPVSGLLDLLVRDIAVSSKL